MSQLDDTAGAAALPMRPLLEYSQVAIEGYTAGEEWRNAVRSVPVAGQATEGVPPMAPRELLEVYGCQVDDLTATAEQLRVGAGVLVAGLRELHTVHQEMAAALATTTPVRTCIDCSERFTWDSSPDPDHCHHCSETHAWHEGASNTTDHPLRLAGQRDPRET